MRFFTAALSALLLVLAGAPAPAQAALPLASAEPDRSVSFDGLVYASVYAGSTVYVGGSFRNAIVNGKSVPRKRLAALDARTGKLLPWAPVSNGTVTALATSGGSLYASGKFTEVGGQSRAGLAGIDLATGAVSAMRPALKGLGQALAVGGGRLYVGGTLTAVDGKKVSNLAALRLTDGALDTSFAGTVDGEVKALTAAGARLYVGGAFKKANNVEGTARLAALRLSDGEVDPGFKPATPYTTMALSVIASRVFAGLAGPGGRVASYQPDGTLVWSTVTDGDIQALTWMNGVVYAGGHFVVACKSPSRTATSWCPEKTLPSQPKLAAYDAFTGHLLDWNPRSNGKWGVLTMSSDMDLKKVAVGGEFTAFGGASQPHFALFGSIGGSCEYGCGGRARR